MRSGMCAASPTTQAAKRWQAKWTGRKAFGEDGNVAIEVIKGAAGTPEEDPYSVDGLSGATITSRGVTNTLDFWLGENGFGPYLSKFRTMTTASKEGTRL